MGLSSFRRAAKAKKLKKAKANPPQCGGDGPKPLAPTAEKADKKSKGK